MYAVELLWYAEKQISLFNRSFIAVHADLCNKMAVKIYTTLQRSCSLSHTEVDVNCIKTSYAVYNLFNLF